MRISPTKPCGKGNKRKQDELDEDEDEEEELEQHTWVEALANELATDEGSEEDPGYQVDTSNYSLTWHLFINELCSLELKVSAHCMKSSQVVTLKW